MKFVRFIVDKEMSFKVPHDANIEDLLYSRQIEKASLIMIGNRVIKDRLGIAPITRNSS